MTSYSTKDAGCLIEPPVSEPIDAKHKPAATEAALPLNFLQVHDLYPRDLMLCQIQVSVELPIANSSRLVFPKQIAPDDHNLPDADDSYGATNLVAFYLNKLQLL